MQTAGEEAELVPEPRQPLVCLCFQIERRLDTVRSMCHHSHKRLMACFQGQHGTDAERRHVSTGWGSEPGSRVPEKLLALYQLIFPKQHQKVWLQA